MAQTIRWRGNPPARALTRALDDARFAIERRGVTHGGGPVVISTSSGRPPSAPPGESRWIWVSASSISAAQAIEAARRGAYAAQSLAVADAPAKLIARLQELVAAHPTPQTPAYIVAESAATRAVVEQVARVAPTSMPVLITGETGTGKEVIARLLHAWSPREQKRFVAINCAAIPNDLMEAQLFGYARGAFSGAVQRYDGQLM